MSSTSDEDISKGDTDDQNPMMVNLLASADRLLEIAEHGLTSNRNILDDPGGGFGGDNNFEEDDKTQNNKPRSLEERLLELHIQESSKASVCANGGSISSHHLNPCSNLVSLLCRKDRLNRLLVTLLPNNEGYSVHILMANHNNHGATALNNDVELFRLPYEDDDFLSYIDNEELPSSILDLLERAWPDLFYSGCVIAEIRDHRIQNNGESNNDAILSHHVLLRPSTQSLICDGNLICERSNLNSKEDRIHVESQLCLATQGPLCLDPDPVVSIIARKSCVRRQKFATPTMRRYAKHFSQVGLNRKRKLEEIKAPPELKMFDFIQGLKRPNPQDMLQQHQAMMRANLRAIVQSQQQVPAGSSNGHMDANIITDVSKHARAIPKRQEVTDMTPHVVEEYILETAERGAHRIYHTKLTIFQRLANDEYLGELYVERDFNEKDKKGSTCRFVLGTRPHALRYINQFTEIFTEEGRKPVKITHLVPNQKPRITLTPGMRERMNERAAQINAARVTASASPAVAAGAVSTPGAPAVVNNGSVAAAAAAAAAQAVVAASGSPTKKPPVLTVTGGPSILQQTLSAPPNNGQNNTNIQTTPTLVRTLSQQSSVTPVLPQTPHPPAPPLPNMNDTGGAPNEDNNTNATNAGNGGEQELAISAIMQSLIKDSAQFEEEHSKKQLVSNPQLPTCPVPQASLSNMSCNSNTSPVKLPSPSTTGSILATKRVTFKNLLSAQAQVNDTSNSPIKSPPVKVTMSQLAAQLSRPITITSSSSNLPSYTQALADQAQGKTIQSSPRPRLLVTAQNQSTLVRSLSDQSGNSTKEVTASTSAAPNLQALLNSEVEPSNVNNVGSGSSLLERLVSGQAISSPAASTSGSGSPSISGSGIRSNADSTNEITLAALLSKPVQNMSPLAASSPGSQMGSPTKASPLIQQLQQPIPPPRPPMPQSPRQQPSAVATQSSPRMTSPRQPPSASPQPQIVRQQSQQQQPGPPPTNLQQQLMQPPKSQSVVSVPVPVQELNTAAAANVHNGTSTNHNGNNMVSLQNLLQSGMAVQVSQHQTQTSNSIPVHLNIAGLQSPVTLSLNLQDQQQQKMVPTSSMVTVASAASTGGTVLIPQGSNIIQLPQQPTASVLNPMTMRTSTGQTVQLHNNIIKGAQVVQVTRQPGSQPLYVQMPVTSTTSGGQSIQIVRSVDQPIVRQHFTTGTAPQQQLILNSVKSGGGQQSLITLSQQPQPQQPQQVVLQANNAVLTTSGSGPPGAVQQTGVPPGHGQPRQVAIQLQEQPPNLMTSGSGLIGTSGSGLTKVMTNQVVVSNPHSAVTNSAVANPRLRQQRKQSLK